MAEAFSQDSVRKSAEVHGIQINYYEAGSATELGGGLPLVMLHGGGPGRDAPGQ